MASQAAPELPRFNRLVYASGSLGGNVISRTKDLWLIYFYAPPAGADIQQRVPILVLGVLFTLARIIGAVGEPLTGWWSDRTHSRWGRRIPFVVLATPFYALFFALLWLPPVAGQSLTNALYFFVMLEAFQFFSSLSGGPFGSLLPEIAITSRARVSVVTWQVFFGALGAALAFVGSGILRDQFGFGAMAAMIAVIGLASRYVGLGGAWRHVRRDVAPARINPLTALRSTLSNDQFLFFMPSFVLFNIAISLMTAALPFWAASVLLRGLPTDIAKLETGHQATILFLGLELNVQVGTIVGLMTAAAIVVVLVALPVGFRLAMRRGKAWVYSTAMLLGALYLPWLGFMGFVPGVDKLTQALLFAGAMGLPMAAVFTFPNAIMADIVDYDELRTGHRREAMYYGTQATLEEMASAIFPLTLALLLVLGSTANDPLGIRLVGPVAGLSALVGYLAFRGYRLPDTVRADTVRVR